MNSKGQILYFRSKTDGRLHPYAVCATDASSESSPLIVEVSPGAISDLEQSVRDVEEIVDVARRHGRSCVAIRPTGVGPGSVYQNYGEVDLFEAIGAVSQVYNVDSRRISITGASMGGAATWYLASHYPDFFAAAAPFCGYADYRLWDKPGGLTFPMNEWEEFSWKSRSAVFLVENFLHTPVWLVHGEWDRSVGGGVPVEHSRRMVSLLADHGLSHRYTELPKTGHGGCRDPQLYEKIILWLLDQEKPNAPEHVSLTTYGLRHNESYWLIIDQLGRYRERGLIDGEFLDDQLLVSTTNIRTFSLGPVDHHSSTDLIIDGLSVGRFDLGARQSFRKHDDGTWELGTFDVTGHKRHSSSGPISDLFFDRTILVAGTSGSDESTFFNRWVASNAASYFKQRNGGVHRGGILGENSVDLAIIDDADLSQDDITNNNLLLYGTHESNSVIGRFRDQLPLRFQDKHIELAGKTYDADGVSVLAVFPHPLNPNRYVAIHGGVTPDAVTWGSHLDMELLPDYIVYSGGEVLDWGFWGNDWR
jgi:pimeloyl-ACP methyl ester carboxylesterase